MPLEFADFAHHYRDSGMTDAQQRDHFAVVSDVLEYIAFHFWGMGSDCPTSLWTDLLGDPTAPENTVESKGKLTTQFNRAAKGTAGGKCL